MCTRPDRDYSILKAVFMPLALSASTTAWSENIDSTVANYGPSNPSVMAPSLDESRAFIAEGAMMTIVNLNAADSGKLPETAQVPLDASIKAFTEDPNGKWVYVAGGSFGVMKVDIGPRNSARCAPEKMGRERNCFPVTTLDDTDLGTPDSNDRWVYSTEIMDHPSGDLLLATFAEQGANVLRVYDLTEARRARGTITPIREIELPASARASSGDHIYGLAYDLAVTDTFAYVAMGSQGFARVDLSNISRPRTLRGPVIDGRGETIFDEPAIVRELAVVDGTLVAAANEAGFIQIDLSGTFNRFTPYTATPLRDPEDSTLPAYALRIAAIERADAEWIAAVGTGTGPVQYREGAPLDVAGTVNYRIEVGGDFGDWTAGQSDGLFLFTPEGHSVASTHTAVEEFPTSVSLGEAWSETRIYVGGNTTAVRRTSTGMPVIAERIAEDRAGKHATRVGASIANPSLLFNASDYLATAQVGMLRNCGNTVTPIPGTTDLRGWGVITNYEAQWTDDSGLFPSVRDFESHWLAHGTVDEWRLRHISVGDVCAGDVPEVKVWKIAPPAEDYGTGGRLVMMGTLNDRYDDDIVFMSRFGARYGLVAYSRSALESAASSTPENGYLGVPPIARFETHPEMATWAPPSSWSDTDIGRYWDGMVGGFGSDLAKLRDDRHRVGWVALTAAGFHAHDPSTGLPVPDAAKYTTAMVTVHDVTHLSTTTTAAPIAVLYGPNRQSSAVAVQTVKAQGRTWAVVADLGGAVHIYDITDVRKTGNAAPLVATWATPISPLDMTHEIAVDIEIQRETSPGEDARIYAYVSLFRGGVAVLDISQPNDPLHIDTLDTPGLAEGLSFDRKDGSPRLLVGDREGGVRVLGPR